MAITFAIPLRPFASLVMTSHNLSLLKALFRSMSVLCVFVTLSLIAMLQHFILTLPKPASGDVSITDGIVVATGGQARIEEGLRLLSEGRASQMLVTGVGKGITHTSLRHTLRLTTAQIRALECCVDLDAAARDTIGNARSAALWADANALKSLRLVTANYHLPRAQNEFQRAFPETSLHVFAVLPPDLKLDTWYRHWPSAKLLVREYGKYLVSLIRF
ncbi:MAG: YdcF family protein [Alphaproteobacteria bacterium]|nr:YdcF family protein [Alphaproteobacteria bacterium]